MLSLMFLNIFISEVSNIISRYQLEDGTKLSQGLKKYRYKKKRNIDR